MLNRVILFNIMQKVTPLFIVFCVFFGLSLNYSFPLHKHQYRSKHYIGLLNGSLQCRPATANKMTSTVKRTKDSPDVSDNDLKADDRKLSGDDLHQYEQLVIMKKYPYLDIKEFEPKYRSLLKNAKYARESDPAEAGNCQLIDDEPHVEIFSRGISGFAIPRSVKNSPTAVDVKLDIQSPPPRRTDTSNDGKVCRGSRIFNRLQDVPENEMQNVDDL